MTTYVLILLAALVLAIGVTPLAQRVARRIGMVDKPSARKQHTVPTPLLGGVAIYLAVILALSSWATASTSIRSSASSWRNAGVVPRSVG